MQLVCSTKSQGANYNNNNKKKKKKKEEVWIPFYMYRKVHMYMYTYCTPIDFETPNATVSWIVGIL